MALVRGEASVHGAVRLCGYPALAIVDDEAYRGPTLAVDLDVGEAGHANKIDAAGDHEAPGSGDRLDTQEGIPMKRH